MMRSILVFASIFLYGQTHAANVILQCGDKALLNSVKSGNVTVDFVTDSKTKSGEDELIGAVKFKSGSVELKTLARLAGVALMNEVDPYALMALYLQGKNSIEVSGLTAARVMECPARDREDMKHFSKEDMTTLGQARDKLRATTLERNKWRGGDDYEEWMVLQKEIDKQVKAIEEFRAKAAKLSGDKKEEMQDQITDASEEIKGLKKEQEEFTKSPQMKKIIALEAQKYALHQEIESIRSRVVKAAPEGHRADVSKEFDCLKSDECAGILLKSDKVANVDLSSGAGNTTEGQVCISGDVLGRGGADLSKSTGTCCAKVKMAAGAKASEELALIAAARGLKDTFSSCTTRPAENDCFAKYLAFKGECAHAYGTKMAEILINELLAKVEVNAMVASEARRLQKPVPSSFCVGQKKMAVTMSDDVFSAEYKKFVAVHKSCTK